MITEVIMPQMGADMNEGTILKWLKNEGRRRRARRDHRRDRDRQGQRRDRGLRLRASLRNIIAQEGEVVQVGDVIALIAAEGEEVTARRSGADGLAAGTDGARPPQRETARPQTQQRQPRPRKLLLPRNLRRSPPPHPGELERVKASPVARRIAQEHNIDLRLLEGSGPEGRVVRRDVEAAVQGERPLPERGPRPLVAPEPDGAPATAAGRLVETSRMRAAIARRMSQSKQQAPHFYVTVDADMTAAHGSSARHSTRTLDEESKVSVNDLIVKACAVTLRQFPNFNAHYIEQGLSLLDDVNICIGVALPDGLIAPSIANCDEKSLVEIARASKDVVERATGRETLSGRVLRQLHHHQPRRLWRGDADRHHQSTPGRHPRRRYGPAHARRPRRRGHRRPAYETGPLRGSPRRRRR